MKRYDMQVGRIKHDCGESFVANMVDVAEGRYVEHAEAQQIISELEEVIDRLNLSWLTMTNEARRIQQIHLDSHEGDVYHAMQSLASKFGRPLYPRETKKS